MHQPIPWAPALPACRHWRFILENVDHVAVPALIDAMQALVQDTRADLDSLVELEARAQLSLPLRRLSKACRCRASVPAAVRTATRRLPVKAYRSGD
jgi:hypothetical protein